MKQSLWNEENILALFELPFYELIWQAYTIHRKNFDIEQMELCTLCSIKTGGCPEDCAYCSQSGHYNTSLKKERLSDINTIISQAKQAQANGAKRFCMGAAWRQPPDKDFPKVLRMIREVKAIGLETCATLGMLNSNQAAQLKLAGLDFYNHNLDTSPTLYKKIISTRTYQQRLETIEHVINAGINVCCGGILGMGETRLDIVQFILELYKLPVPPKSIPINKLVPIIGTPLEDADPLDHFEFIRTIAVTRLIFTKSNIRLSAGRENMSEEMQAWCFMAGANSIFIGDKLLTAKNPEHDQDYQLLNKLNIRKSNHKKLTRSC